MTPVSERAIEDLLIAVAKPDAAEDSPERQEAWDEIKRRVNEADKVHDYLDRWMGDAEEPVVDALTLAQRAYDWGDHAWGIAGRADEAKTQAQQRLDSALDALANILDLEAGWHQPDMSDQAKLQLAYRYAREGMKIREDIVEFARPLPLLDQAREEWDALGLMSYHGVSDGLMFADLGEDDIVQIRNLIRRLAARLTAHERSLMVLLDPSVADWTPTCHVCERRIESWADAVGLPASPIEDDEPTGVVFVHYPGCPVEPCV